MKKVNLEPRISKPIGKAYMTNPGTENTMKGKGDLKLRDEVSPKKTVKFDDK